MKASLIVGAFLVSFLCAPVANAQTSEPAWLPSPETVFADGVQWEIIEETPIAHVPIGVDEALIPTCGGHATQNGLEYGWVVGYPEHEDEHVFLCNVLTGEQRDILPAELTEWSEFPSPNKNRILLLAKDWSIGGDYRVYVYSIAENQLMPLGTVSRGIDNAVALCGWVSETKGLLCSADIYRSWPGIGYYAFDITQPDSIEYAFGGWEGGYAFHLDDPVRYISVYSEDFVASITGSRSSEHEPCMLTIYDADNVRHQELGYECIPVVLDEWDSSPYYRLGNTLYYLTIEGENATISSLYSYDVELEAGSNVLFKGEIESVIGVSPDGQYFVLLMDDNGVLDFPWWSPFYPQDRGWQVAVVHRPNGQVVYLSEPIGVFAAGQVVWLDNQTVTIAAQESWENIRTTERGDVTIVQTLPSLRRITFNDDSSVDVVITTRYGGARDVRIMDVSSDHRYWLRDDQQIIDLWDFQPVPIFRDGTAESYDTVVWLEDGDFWVRLRQPDNHSESVLYRVVLGRHD
ncbi:MAG: hypothetical protein H6671_02480 [Anaerolineaceae bacterium]|nr:hypothetical protein [Anaerolineaceae bacterium]